jgi:hypothetical protein
MLTTSPRTAPPSVKGEEGREGGREEGREGLEVMEDGKNRKTKGGEGGDDRKARTWLLRHCCVCVCAGRVACVCAYVCVRVERNDLDETVEETSLDEAQRLASRLAAVSDHSSAGWDNQSSKLHGKK